MKNDINRKALAAEQQLAPATECSDVDELIARLRDPRYSGQGAMRASAADEIERLWEAIAPFAALGVQYANKAVGYGPTQVLLRGPDQCGELVGEWEPSELTVTVNDFLRAALARASTPGRG